MRKSLFATLAGVMFALSPAHADDLDQKIESFRGFLIDYRKENSIPSFSVALVKDGEIIFAEGFGWQDHDGEEPTTVDTTYLVASITKTFAAATLLAMAEDGHIRLDEDFTDLSDWDERCEWLVNSGIIFGGATLDDGTVIEPMQCEGPITLAQVLSHQVNGKPGSSFLYNPVVFGRLSNYVEEQTGRPFQDWMHEYVIEPGGLANTAAGWRDPGRGHVLTKLAPPFKFVKTDEDADGIAPSTLPNPELNASSGVIASARELARYSIALDENRVLSGELKERMWSPPANADGEPAPYAYGWWVQNWRGYRLVWHGGWWPDAYAGLLLKAPDDGWTLVALGNTDGIHWGNRLDRAEVEKSALAAKFLELFVAE